MASTEERELLKKYLLERESRFSRMNSPEAIQARNESASGFSDAAARNNLGASLMGASAQIGTVGGKHADYSQEQNYADARNKANSGFMGRLDSDESDREKRYSDNLDIRKYLAGLEQKDNEDIAENTYKAQTLAQNQESEAQKLKIANAEAAVKKAQADREFQLKRDELALKQKESMIDGGGKPATEAQLMSANYGRKAQDADALIKSIEASGYNPASYGRSLRNPNIPGIGGVISSVAASQDDRKYIAAQKEFIAAILRKESGGAITTEEFRDYGSMYFPQAGDGPEVIAQKADMRKSAAANLIAMAGNKAASQIGNRPAPQISPPSGGMEDTAIGGPKEKPLEEMSDSELEAYIKNGGG